MERASLAGHIHENPYNPNSNKYIVIVMIHDS